MSKASKEVLFWIGATSVIFGLLVYAQYLSALPKPEPIHTPEFAANQCFVKELREPWDADVAGIVNRVGYNKYLVIYASEADRRSLGAKQGWEEDIRTFDSKYISAPCPESWVNHRRN